MINANDILALPVRSDLPAINPGDTVKVSARIVEGNRERVQPFEGVVIHKRNTKSGCNFTVRRVAQGIGIERTFSVNSPRLERVEVLRHGKVRRAKLYYLRALSGKAARIKERSLIQES